MISDVLPNELMRELSQKILDSCDLRAYVVSDGLPDLITLCDFVAQRVIQDLNAHPSDVFLALSSSIDRTYQLKGSVTIDCVESPITGTILWLPNLTCFRGRVRIVPQPSKSEVRNQELIKAYSGASEKLSADGFYANVRDDGLSKIESLHLLKYFYGMMLSESLDVHTRYETRHGER